MHFWNILVSPIYLISPLNSSIHYSFFSHFLASVWLHFVVSRCQNYHTHYHTKIQYVKPHPEFSNVSWLLHF